MNGITDIDLEIAGMLRRSKKNILVMANKAEHS
jgi:predicted GTPase